MKNSNFLLSASLISSDLSKVGMTIKELEKGKVDLVHFDIMDGTFVPRFGLPLELLSLVKASTKIPVNVHLMTANLEPYINTIANSGASLLTFHIEATNHAARIIDLIHQTRMGAGIAINPATPLTVLNHILDDLDLITLMAISPGIAKHPLIPATYDKLTHLRKMIPPHKNIKIEIDGGINQKTAVKAIKTGADVLVCGHSIFAGSGSLSQRIKKFRRNITKNI